MQVLCSYTFEMSISNHFIDQHERNSRRRLWQENTTSSWATRRKEAREWRDAFTAKEILEAVDELPDDLGEEQLKYPIGVSLIQVFAETHRAVLFGRSSTKRSTVFAAS
jgi:hypothetical protein